MKAEIALGLTKKLPDGAVLALEKELLKRLHDHYAICSRLVRRAGSDGLSVHGGAKEVKKKLERILQETRESADDWFY
ncbi:TPA: DinI family protein [Enterobacter hormaechei]|uniref:DinI family protein n=1 Tax=Enterobacter hormaechei TaxID=158836 RepID=UPI0015D4BE75|nr:DinI family protein [Enterobacter hormaechei]EKY3920325.1 DinI family protein [Enterobacter hormaechei]HAV1873055.1 DinI family protein [Enterobacter hormaechei subsp. steigerwaltii]HDV8214067.1 DinI family protein [Enterobacter hormaechei]